MQALAPGGTSDIPPPAPPVQERSPGAARAHVGYLHTGNGGGRSTPATKQPKAGVQPAPRSPQEQVLKRIMEGRSPPPSPQGFFRIIKYQGGGGGPKPPPSLPQTPPPFPILPKFSFVVRDIAYLLGVPPSLWGTKSAVYPPLLALDSFVSLLFLVLVFSFLSVKRRCLQVWCQGRPRGSLAGCGGPRGRLGTRESRRARQRVTLIL